MAGLCFCFFALVLFFPFLSDQIGGGFLVCYFFSSLSLLLFVFFGCSDGMEREACVCDHGFERSDLCAEIIINNNAYIRPNNTLIVSESKQRVIFFYNCTKTV